MRYDKVVKLIYLGEFQYHIIETLARIKTRNLFSSFTKYYFEKIITKRKNNTQKKLTKAMIDVQL